MKMTLTLILLTLSLQSYCPEFRTLYLPAPERIWYIDISEVEILLKKHNIKYPKIVKAQILLETGHLKSDILRVNFNLMGMRYAPQRQTTSIGERYGCAVYKSIDECIQDLAIWQRLFFKRGGSYYDFLERIGYAEDKDYIKKLKQLSN
jgi:flagellum-specific peptidoglycan hydrolase FlgJ